MIPYQLTDEAKADLLEAIDYIAQDSPPASARLESRMLKAFQHLAQWPNSGRLTREHPNRPLRFWVEGNYLVLYDPYALPLTVLAIFHGAQDVARLMAERLEESVSE